MSWSRETLIVVLEQNKVFRCGPNNAKIRTPLLGDLYNFLAKPYLQEFSNSDSICYYPIDSQIKATEQIRQIIYANLNKNILNNVAQNVGNLITKSTNEIDIKSAKEFIKKIGNSEDSEFLQKLCETQMFATYIKEKFDFSTQNILQNTDEIPTPVSSTHKKCI